VCIMANELIRILHLDDNPADAQLVALTLEQEKLPHTLTYVQTREEFLAALRRKDCDIILSDYRMPGYDGDQALQAAQQICPEVPFIMVTGELGEELVIETLQRGATDYVLKDRIFRLIPAIKRALAEAENERKRRDAEAAREQLVKELGRRQGELLVIIQAMHGGVTVLDTKGNVVLVNEAMAKMFGYKDAAELERNFFHLFEEYEFEDYDGHSIPVGGWPIERIMHGETIVNRELHGRRKGSGTEWFFSFSGQPVKDENGNQILSVLVVRDITSRKQAEEELRRAERATGEILESIQYPFFSLDHDWRVTYMNAKAGEFLKRVHDELLGQSLWEVFPELRGTDTERILRNAMETRQPQHQEHRSVLYDVWLDTHVFPRADGGLSVLYQDITERKKHEAALHRSEERFAATFMSSPYPLALSRIRDGMVLEVNDTLLELYGARRDEVVGKTTFQLGIWTDIRERERILEIIKREGKIYEAETTLRNRTGELRRVVVTVTLLSAGEEPMVLSVISDITERKRMEERLKESEELSRLALAAGKAGAWSWDLRTNSVQWSEEFYRTLGIAPGTSITEHLDEGLARIHPEDRERVVAAVERARTTGDAIDVILRVICPDGSPRWVRGMAKAFFDAGAEGLPVRLAGLVTDVTEQIMATEDLENLVRERTAALQRANHELEAFSYTVAHDLKAPLRIIDSFSKLLADPSQSLPADKERQYLDLIQSSAAQMTGLIESLLSFARTSRQEVHKEAVNMRTLVEQVLQEQRHSLGDRGSHVHIVIGDDMPSEASGDPVLLKQVLANFLSNAFKFTRTTGEPEIEIGGYRDAGELVYFVRDNGVGFPAKDAEKLFQVFQRLHRQEDFEGTGIGLANVRKIVERHGGCVRAEAEEGKGATFYFTLPARTEK
jgi:PAS domain S-box-containing protein